MPTKNLGTKKIPHLIKRNAYTYNKMKTIIIITINKKGYWFVHYVYLFFIVFSFINLLFMLISIMQSVFGG